MRTECVDAEARMVPLKHVAGQPLVDQLAFEEEPDHGGAEVPSEYGEVYPWDVHESAGRMEGALKHNDVKMRIEPPDLPRARLGR